MNVFCDLFCVQIDVCAGNYLHFCNFGRADPTGRYLAGIADSNLTRGINVCLLYVLYVVSGRPLCDGPITRFQVSPTACNCIIVCGQMQQ